VSESSGRRNLALRNIEAIPRPRHTVSELMNGVNAVLWNGVGTLCRCRWNLTVHLIICPKFPEFLGGRSRSRGLLGGALLVCR